MDLNNIVFIFNKVYNLKYIKITITLILVIVLYKEYEIFRDYYYLNKSSQKALIIDNSEKIINLLKNLAIKKSGNLFIQSIEFVDNASTLTLTFKAANIYDVYSYIEQALALGSLKELQKLSTKNSMSDNSYNNFNNSKASSVKRQIPFVFYYLNKKLEQNNKKKESKKLEEHNDSSYKYESMAEFKVK